MPARRGLTLDPISGESVKSDLEALAPLGTAVIFSFLAGPTAGTFAEVLAKPFQTPAAVRVSDICIYFGDRPQTFSAELARVCGFLARASCAPKYWNFPGRGHRSGA
jgi:NADPH2:quinone reductase